MTNFAEEGLASLFSKHGCSTGSEDGWTVASRKKNKKKNEKNVNHTDGNTFNPPVLTVHTFKPGDEDLSEPRDLNRAHMGVSPFVASKNKFESLYEWEDNTEEEEMEEGEIKECDFEYKTSSPSKKIKLDHNSSVQENFDEILKEFTDKDAEFALSASEASKTTIFKSQENGTLKNVPPEEDTVRENRKKVVIDRTVADTITASEMIQDHTELYQNYYADPDPAIVKASEEILNHPKLPHFVKKVSELPRPYYMHYPVSTLILLSHYVEWNCKVKPWRSHGTRKKQEIELDESTFIMYEIKRLGL